MFWIPLTPAQSTQFCWSERLLMPKYGLFGPRLKAPLLRKFLKVHRRKRRESGSLPEVKLGLKNAGDVGVSDHRRRSNSLCRAVTSWRRRLFAIALADRDERIAHVCCWPEADMSYRAARVR